jgi:hypothetical protein
MLPVMLYMPNAAVVPEDPILLRKEPFHQELRGYQGCQEPQDYRDWQGSMELQDLQGDRGYRELREPRALLGAYWIML